MARAGRAQAFRAQRYSALPVRAAGEPHELARSAWPASGLVGRHEQLFRRLAGVALVLLGVLLVVSALIKNFFFDRQVLDSYNAGDQDQTYALPPQPSPPWWKQLPLAQASQLDEIQLRAPTSEGLELWMEPPSLMRAPVGPNESNPPSFPLSRPPPASPPQLPEEPPATCEVQLASRLNLREQTPPTWCASLRGDASRCVQSYVTRADGLGFSLCEFILDSGTCLTSSERLSCPPPPPPPPRPPNPPNPPPAIPPLPIITQINQRFSRGGPSPHIADAGVLVHTFDEITDSQNPWLPCHESRWCANLRDRFAASLLYPGFADIYTKGDGGFVISPDTVGVLCSYHGDGHSMAKACDEPGVSATCVPGCGGGYDQCEVVQKTSWCSCRNDDFLCAWKPEELQQMMMQQRVAAPNGFLTEKGYNEVILDAETWVNNLPRTVQAVFAVSNSDEAFISRAKSVHQRFQEEFNVRIPLLYYNHGQEPPFTLFK